MIRFGFGDVQHPVANLGQSVQGLLNGRPFGLVSVTEYGALADGTTDDAAAIMAAHAALPPQGGRIMLPPGTIRIASQIDFTKRVVFTGHGYTSSSSEGAASRILKDGDFTGIVLHGNGSLIEKLQVDGTTGNGGDGIQIAAARCFLRDVAITNQGQHGVRVGDDEGSNVNSWGFDNVITVANGSDGVFVDDPVNGSLTLPNTNSGLVNKLDTRANGRDGLRLAQAIDCQFNLVTSQLNGAVNVHLMEGAEGHHFHGLYAEHSPADAANEVVLEEGALRNWFWGWRSGTDQEDIVDNNGATSTNMIFGRDSQFHYYPMFRNPVSAKLLNLTDPSISGAWAFYQDPTNRKLLIELQGTSATPVDVDFTHANSGTVKLSADQLTLAAGSTVKGFLGAGGTLNFGSVDAGGVKDATLTVTGATTSDACYASARFALNAGIMVSCYIAAANTVTVRIHNTTDGAISVNGAFRAVVVQFA